MAKSCYCKDSLPFEKSKTEVYISKRAKLFKFGYEGVQNKRIFKYKETDISTY